MMKKRSNGGFSLIELMIVFAVLSILAAIVIPTFSNASETAKAGSLAAQITTVKKALTLYKNDHNGFYPTGAQMITSQWQALINSTDVDGLVSGDDYGPYFMKAPFNAFMDSDVVASDNTAAWQYDASTGTIQATVPAAINAQAASLQLDPLDLVVAP